MITDHSSAGFEYLLLDRPIVRIHVPALIALANIHPDYVMLLESASTQRDRCRPGDDGRRACAGGSGSALGDAARRRRRPVLINPEPRRSAAPMRCTKRWNWPPATSSAPRTAALHEIDGERADAGSSVTTPDGSQFSRKWPARRPPGTFVWRSDANRQRNHSGVQRRAVLRRGDRIGAGANLCRLRSS